MKKRREERRELGLGLGFCKGRGRSLREREEKVAIDGSSSCELYSFNLLNPF